MDTSKSRDRRDRRFKSDPLEDHDQSIQYALVHPTIFGDILRVDNEKNGLVNAYWLSKITIPEFLNAAETYFHEFEDQFTGDTEPIMRVGIVGREVVYYPFGRPINLIDFEKEGVFIGDSINPLGFLRLDTPPVDVIYETANELIELMTNLEVGKEQLIIDAAARFINLTQPLIPLEPIKRLMGQLPYKKA
jgi:hypothetical protein